jgi:hypothetical protein
MYVAVQQNHSLRRISPQALAEYAAKLRKK